MIRKKKPLRRIGAFFSFRSRGSREQVLGIMRFAATHPEWDLRIFMRPDSSADLRALARQFAPDGIITGDPAVAEVFLRRHRRRMPCVIADYKDPEGRVRLRRHGFAFVDSDDAAIAREAAELFLRRGYTSFGLVRPASAFAELGEVFVRTLRDAGFPCEVRCEKPGQRDFLGLDVPDVVRWLKGLPKPCAVFTTSDAYAQALLNACREAALAVPQEVAVLGIDNDELICENTSPALSSVELDYVRGGFLAAETLDRMLRGRSLANRQFRYPVLRTVERASTQNAIGARRRAVLAQERLRERALSGVSVVAIAKELNVSVRQLEMDFRKSHGSSMREELVRIRLEEGRRLLRTTKAALSEIARRSGFRTAAAFSAVFRRKFGLSPRAFRKECTGH